MRLRFMPVLAVLAASGLQAAEPLPVDPDSWRAAERIEFVYVAPDLPPGINYLPAARVDPADRDSIAAMRCRGAGPADRRVSRARWIWQVEAALRDPVAFADSLREDGLDAAYLQVPPDPEAFAPLLVELSKRGIRAHALDGHPGAADEPDGLLRVLDGVLAFNARHPVGFSGFEVDVEPYVRPGFSLDEDLHYQRFLDLLALLRERRPAGFELSAVVPFWYSQKRLDGNNLVARILVEVDGLAIMAYRTEPTEIARLSAPTLCLAQAAGKQVRVGLESTFLKDEEHYIVARSRLEPLLDRKGEQWRLPGGPVDGVPVDERYTVRGRTLSFHGNPAGLASQLQRALPYESFSGWVVNGAP